MCQAAYGERLNMHQSLPDAIKSVFGSDKQIVSADRVSGGDINRAFRLTLKDGTCLFMKSNLKANLPFFTAEMEGLSAIAGTGTIRTPSVLGIGTDETFGAFLLLEWAEAALRVRNYWENFGHALAAMHLADTALPDKNDRFGFPHDNFIGAGMQINTPSAGWVSFFRDSRLVPMLKRAAPYLDSANKRNAAYLLDHLENYLIEPERPSLLHGDLWAGNYITGSDGEAWLIDPAAYIGHAEADIAMTELFGGFSSAFYDAYREVYPLQPGYEGRRDLYNLYHLLNHLNLFGAAYLDSVRRVLRRYG